MGILDKILAELDGMYIVEYVTNQHDKARIKFYLEKNTISDDWEFDKIISDYYNYHLAECGEEIISTANAMGKAKDIIFDAYMKKGKDIIDVYNDARTGTNGGLRIILDIIMEHLKNEAVQYHINDVVDRHTEPLSYDEKLEIIKELIKRGKINPGDVDKN